ncbi:uncharacterized protein EKO05_0009969 [Ascochyta rabiei]|uniref:uncharacterized protein n=1 Tax=Didymella rabiei TaxID=5454 RepID=UPI002207FA2B|nr:uncharacterized protein EKO05_0009969 [Ascochyta rabiei]UPX19715.1 hypothetical protein EKO05_0009969 [Ascochyta rabiei]
MTGLCEDLISSTLLYPIMIPSPSSDRLSTDCVLLAATAGLPSHHDFDNPPF